MLKQYASHFSRVFQLCDISLVLFSFYAAYCLRFGSIPLNPKTLPTEFQVFLLANFPVWIYLANRFQLYASKRMISLTNELLDVGKSVTISVAIAAIPSFFIRDEPLSRIFLVTLWTVQLGSLSLFHAVVRATLKFVRRRGYNYRHVLIVGRNDRAARLVSVIEGSPELGMRILGFIDSPNGNRSTTSFNGYRLLGELEDLERVLRDEVLDEVFVVLPIKSFYSEMQNILNVCESAGVDTKIPADLFSLTLARIHVSAYGGVHLVDFQTGPRMCLQLVFKRLLDVSVSSILLALHAPLFAIVAVAIRLDSKGPVFFRQPRVGYNGRTFNCLKFRTMVHDAEQLKASLAEHNEMDGPVFKIRNDPRVTRIGKVLRKASFDELPQLISVLKGDMSLVGPRPPVPEEVNRYQLKDRRRLSMRPGITCLWQVSGRSNVSFKEWMELDRRYIDQWSLWLDVKILARTIPAVIRGSGAV